MNQHPRQRIKELIRTVPNWPREGIMFRDITSLIKGPQGLKLMVEEMVKRYRGKKIDTVVGIEARGFIIGPIVAHQLNLGFVPIRKKGKLPGSTLACNYQLEYGTDTLEIQTDALKDGEQVLLVDDILATGGTILAALDLIGQLGGEVVETCFIADLPELGGGAKLDKKGIDYFSLTQFEGE